MVAVIAFQPFQSMVVEAMSGLDALLAKVMVFNGLRALAGHIYPGANVRFFPWWR